jgi:hypothetical protein
MTSLKQNRIIVAIALLLPSAVSLWLLTRSATAVTATDAGLVALLIATALIGLNTWKNGQPTGSIGQLIHETDVAPSYSANARRALDLTNARRWDAWYTRGESVAYTGRVRALLALSVVATAALLYVWLA